MITALAILFCGYLRTLDGRDAISRPVFWVFLSIIIGAVISHDVYALPLGLLVAGLGVVAVMLPGHDLPAPMDGMWKPDGHGPKFIRTALEWVLPVLPYEATTSNSRSHLRGGLAMAIRWLVYSVPIFLGTYLLHPTLLALALYPAVALVGLMYWLAYYWQDQKYFRRNAPAEWLSVSLLVTLLHLIVN